MTVKDTREPQPAIRTMPPESAADDLAAGIESRLGEGFDQATAQAAEDVGGRILLTLPATGILDDASRLAAVMFGTDEEPRIVFAVLDEAGAAVRVEASGGDLEDMTGLVRSFVDVLGHLSTLDLAEVEAA